MQREQKDKTAKSPMDEAHRRDGEEERTRSVRDEFQGRCKPSGWAEQCARDRVPRLGTQVPTQEQTGPSVIPWVQLCGCAGGAGHRQVPAAQTQRPRYGI